MPIRKFAMKTIKISKIKDELQACLNDRQSEISAGIVKEKWNAFKSIV